MCNLGFYLTQSLTCSPNCLAPCATCLPGNPSVCGSCVAGYALYGNYCSPITSCNGACSLCPMGYTLEQG